MSPIENIEELLERSTHVHVMEHLPIDHFLTQIKTDEVQVVIYGQDLWGSAIEISPESHVESIRVASRAPREHIINVYDHCEPSARVSKKAWLVTPLNISL